MRNTLKSLKAPHSFGCSSVGRYYMVFPQNVLQHVVSHRVSVDIAQINACILDALGDPPTLSNYLLYCNSILVYI